MGFYLLTSGIPDMMTSLKTKSNKVFSKGFKKLHRRNKMLRTRRTPKDRAAFPPVSLLKPTLLTETFYPSCFFAS